MAIINLPDQTYQLLSGITLSGTPVSSDALDVTTWIQGVVEVYPSNMTGTVRLKIQWSNQGYSDNTGATGGQWMADPVQYTSGATPSGSELTIPLYEQEHSWNANAPFLIATPINNKYVRIVAEGTDGNVTVNIRRIR